MDEKEIKKLCKFIIEYGNRKLTDVEKEIIKQSIDSSENIEQLFLVALSTFNWGNK